MTSPQGTGLPLNFKSGGLEVIDAPVPVEVNYQVSSIYLANTPQILTDGSYDAYNFIAITNMSASDTVKIGGVDGQTIPLAPGQTAFFDVHQAPINTAYFYFVGPNAGDTVGVIWS